MTECINLRNILKNSLWEKNNNNLLWQLFIFSIKMVLKFFRNNLLITILKTPLT